MVMTPGFPPKGQPLPHFALPLAARFHDAAKEHGGKWSVAISFRGDIGYGLSASVKDGEVVRGHGATLVEAFVNLFEKIER